MTRQKIIDGLKIENTSWYDTLTDVEFLGRLYDRTSLPSDDIGLRKPPATSGNTASIMTIGTMIGFTAQAVLATAEMESIVALNLGMRVGPLVPRSPSSTSSQPRTTPRQSFEG